MNKITIVTAAYIGNERDTVILSPQTVYDNVEYIVYTNDPDLNVFPWKPIVDTSIDGMRMSARHKKTQLSKLHPSSDYFIWIDSYFKINKDPNDLITKYLINHDIAVLPHPERNNIIEEANILLQWKPEQSIGLQEQIDFYYTERYVPISLYETGIMIQRNTKKIQLMQDLWWYQLQNYCIRDQISFPYVTWKLGISVNTFPGTHSTSELRKQNKPWLPMWNEVIK
jgi:hypothetical protein